MSASTDDKFFDLYATYGQRIRDYCARRLTPDLVEDAVADTFAVAWRKIDQVPDGAEALPWLYGVAYRVLSHMWRNAGRTARLRSKIESVAVVSATDTADIVVQHEDYRLVLEAAFRLAPIDREILRLSMWEEMSSADVGSILGITPNAAKQRLHRAKQRLVDEFRSLTGELASGLAQQQGDRT